MTKIKNNTECKKRRSSRRAVTELVLSVIGALIFAAAHLAFIRAFDASADEGIAVAYDNYMLYYKLSSVLSAVLLVLTMISSLCAAVSRDSVRAFHITVSAAPTLSSALLVALALFYAYLTHGGRAAIAPYLIALGLGEALVLRLPCALYSFIGRGENIIGSKGK